VSAPKRGDPDYPAYVRDSFAYCFAWLGLGLAVVAGALACSLRIWWVLAVSVLFGGGCVAAALRALTRLPKRHP
jgi:cell division protein FtsX